MSSVDRVREELAGEFRAMVRERVESVTRRWSAIEQAAAWVNVDELLGELHTLKGETRLMGFIGCATLVHAAEELVAGERHHGQTPRREVGDTLFAILGAVERRTQKSAADDRADDDEVRGFEIQTRGETPTPVAPEVTKQTQAPASIASLGQTEDNAIRDLRAESLDAFSDTARELVASHVRYEIALRDLGRNLHAAANGNTHALDSATASYADLVEDVHRGHNHASLLNERALALRLAPVKRTIDRFTRPIRELGRTLGKEVVLETMGGEAMLDRHVVDRLFDPLMHLLRNAIDHGIETPELRVKRGKPPLATIRLSVVHAGNRATVRVEDDGSGFDLDAIRGRASELGLLGDRTDHSSDELIALTFTPGFTTRRRATETSGRGVGLDVVRRAIDQMGGVLRVSTEPGRGSVFELDVPATLSLTEVLLVSVSGSLFALPTRGLNAVTSIEDARPTRLNGRAAIMLHGEAVPYAALGSVLGLPESVAARTVIVATDRARVAIGIDAWRDVLDCVVMPLPDALSAERLLVGATAIGGGTVALVVNTTELLQRSLGGDAVRRAVSAKVVKADTRRRILLVEDSVITRTMLSRLLAASGYIVREAEDGMHAMEILEGETFDVMLTDIDMPRMNGFDLITAVRRIERYRGLPIVVLTTRGAEADRARAAAAGANAYLTKTSFSEAELRAALERPHG